MAIWKKRKSVCVRSLHSQLPLIRFFRFLHLIHEFLDQILAIHVLFRLPTILRRWISLPGNQEFPVAVPFEIHVQNAFNLRSHNHEKRVFSTTLTTNSTKPTVAINGELYLGCEEFVGYVWVYNYLEILVLVPCGLVRRIFPLSSFFSLDWLGLILPFFLLFCFEVGDQLCAV